MILATFDGQITPMIPTKFQVNWLFGRRSKTDFHDGRHGGHLGFLIGMFLAIFDLSVSQCFLPSFNPTGLLVQEKRKIDFQDGGHLRFLIGTILAIFNLQVIPMLPTQFQVNGHDLLVSAQEVKIHFQDGHHGGHLGFLIGMILATFDLQVLDASYQVLSQLAFRFRRRSEK